MLSAVACDVFVVATEPTAHAELVALAMHRGVHVICEKPLTVTRADHTTVADACRRRPDLALVPVHQYRYSPQWAMIARCIRAATYIGRRYTLTVDVCRQGADRFAALPWRADATRSGGMLADAGVHFLALAWSAHHQLKLLDVDGRIKDSGAERSTATYRVGPGLLTINVRNDAIARSTRMRLRVGALTVRWQDDQAHWSIGRRAVCHRRVLALSDREHVDALYLQLYQDVANRLARQQWRERRTGEALSVGEALVQALERTRVAA
jgi:hypothetical protein